MFRTRNSPGLWPFYGWRCLTPVSYTHLDVYKRQIALREKSIKPNIGVLIGAIFMNVSPLIFQNVNKNIYNGIENCKSYKVLDKSKSTGRRPHFSFKVMLDDKKRTIDCEEVVWDKIEINKSVEICIVNGGFGFDYIKNLSPLNE